jgi:hypothetical protein
MDRVDEIKAAIDRLSPEEYRRVVAWLREREQDSRDAKLDRDSASFRLDFLFTEAESEPDEGLLEDWPRHSDFFS